MCKSKVFKYCYTIACISTAFGMTVLWICRYSLDEDSVKIDLKQFQFLEGQYPMISVCLVDPFIESKIKEYNDTLSGEKYRQFLMGERFSIQTRNISFEDVTLNLADFYIGDEVYFRNGSYKQGESPNFIHEIPRVTYTGFYGLYFFKCYGIKSKSSSWSHETDFYGATFSFNASLFPNGIRPHSEDSIIIFLHMQNQWLLAGNYGKYSWPKRTEKKEYTMSFTLTNFEILKRRNKWNDPCQPDDSSFDQNILEDHLNTVGCRAPYQKTKKNLSICDSKEKMKEASHDLMSTSKPKKACTSSGSIIYTYDENDINIKGSDWFHIMIWFPDQYKEIVMVRAIDIETVIANAGGYIGLFLGMVAKSFIPSEIYSFNCPFISISNKRLAVSFIGYAVLQLPDFLLNVQQLCKDMIENFFVGIPQRKRKLFDRVEALA